MSSRELKLQVVLSALDKITGPLKQITKGNSALSEALQNNKAHLKALDKQQSDIRGYRIASVEAIKQARAIRDLDVKSRGYSQALEEQRAKHVNLGANLKAAQTQYNRLTKAMFDGKGGTAEFQRELQKAQVTLLANRQAFDRSAASIKTYQERIRHADDRMQQLNRQQKTTQERLAGLKTRLETAGIGTEGLRGKAQNLRIEQERMNKTLAEQKAALEKVNAVQKRSAALSEQHGKAMRKVAMMGGLGAGGIAVGQRVYSQASRMLTPGVAFGEQMSELQAISRLDKDDERFVKLSQQARDLGASTAFTAADAAAGQTFLARAGFSPEAIHASMQDMLNLALANKMDLARTADIASNISSAFKIDPEAAGSMQRVGDVLSGVAARTNVNLESLGDTMKYLGGAEDLNISLEQAAAMAGLMGNIGIQGSQAGTAMRAMMNRLTAPAKSGIKAMEAIGLKVADSNGQMRDMPDLLQDIAKATEHMGNVQRKQIMKDIFGTEAGSGMTELVSAMASGDLLPLLNELQNGVTGENAKMANIMADNIGGDLKGLVSAWQEVGIAMTDANGGPIRELIQSITGAVRWIGEWVKENPKLAGTLGKIVGIIAVVATVFGTLAVTAATILGPLSLLRFAFGHLLLNGPMLIGMLKGLGAGFGFVRVLATGFFRLMFGFIRANPIAALVIGVAAAIYDLAARWEQIKSYFNAGEWMKLAGAVMQGLEAGLNAATLGLYGVFKKIIVGLVDVFRNLLGINSPSRLFTDFGGMIMDGLINGIKNKLNSVKEVITGVGSSLTGWFKDTLGIRSPSRVFAALGGDTVAGLSVGIQANADGPLKRIGELGKKLTAAAGLSIPLLAGAVEPITFDSRPPLSAAATAGTPRAGDTVAGLSVGIQANADGPLKRIGELGKKLTAAAGLSIPLLAGAVEPITFDSRPPLSAAATAGTPRAGDTIIINVHATPGMDTAELARLVQQELQKAQLQKQMHTRSRIGDLE